MYMVSRTDVRLLKLVTGVDTSTRPASRSGRAGKRVKSSMRAAAAAAKSSSLCWRSMAMSCSYACSLAAVVVFWQDASSAAAGPCRRYVGPGSLVALAP